MESTLFQVNLEPGVEDIRRGFKPTDAQVKWMIGAILANKGWTGDKLAGVLGVAFRHLVWLKGTSKLFQRPNETLRRLIWLLYWMDISPEELRNPAFVLTWGATAGLRVPDVSPNEDQLAEMAQELRREKPGEMTRQDVMAYYGVTQPVAKRLIRLAGYRCKAKPKPVPAYLRPGSKWQQVDWAKSNDQIARHLGMSVITVRAMRRKFNPEAP